MQKEKGEGAVLGQPLHTPAAWTATDVLSRPAEWQYVLSPADRAEIVAATRHALATKKAVPVRGQGGAGEVEGAACAGGRGGGRLASAGSGERRRRCLSSSQQACQCPHTTCAPPALPPLQDLRCADFPLPTLGPKLEQFRKSVVWGLGFQLLRRKSVGSWAGGEAGVFYALPCSVNHP
jgi:hypothetical protein